jgi:hypothetical protein
MLSSSRFCEVNIIVELPSIHCFVMFNPLLVLGGAFALFGSILSLVFVGTSVMASQLGFGRITGFLRLVVSLI